MEESGNSQASKSTLSLPRASLLGGIVGFDHGDVTPPRRPREEVLRIMWGPLGEPGPPARRKRRREEDLVQTDVKAAEAGGPLGTSASSSSGVPQIWPPQGGLPSSNFRIFDDSWIQKSDQVPDTTNAGRAPLVDVNETPVRKRRISEIMTPPRQTRKSLGGSSARSDATPLADVIAADGAAVRAGVLDLDSDGSATRVGRARNSDCAEHAKGLGDISAQRGETRAAGPAAHAQAYTHRPRDTVLSRLAI